LDERRERVIDLAVVVGALIIGSFLVWQSLARTSDPRETIQGEIRIIEQSGMVQDASMALPAETRTAIGLEGLPAATYANVLAELETEVAATSQVTGYSIPSTLVMNDPGPAANPSVRAGQAVWVPYNARLVLIALAVGWRQDPLARAKIAELANDPVQLQAHRTTLDELLRLANGKGAEGIAALEATYQGYGASRWLLGHLRERHLANIADPGAPPLAAELTAIAQSAVSRWTLIAGLELFLFPTIGLIVLVLFPMFLRQRMLERGLAADLVPSPFRIERSWRVFFAWFVAFQVAGYTFVIILAMVSSGPQVIAITMAIQALASTALAFAFIDLWARLPRDERTVPMALGLAGGSRIKMIFVWAVPGLALAMTLVRAADYLNLVLMRRPPDTQSVVQLVIDDGSPALMLLIGLGAVVLAPLAEEIVFRGFLFRNLRDSLGKGLAMLLSGLAFAAVHFEPTLLLPLTALGVALALLYEWSGSLYVPIAVHALWNLFALIKIELWRI